MILLELLGELFPYILTGVCIGIYVLIEKIARQREEEE